MKPILTSLNLEIIQAILRYRLMTTTQVHKLVFLARPTPGTENSVANTLRKLHGRGFVSRDWLAVKPTQRSMLSRPSAVWFLRKENFENLCQELSRTARADVFEDILPFAKVFKEGTLLAENTLRHELAITDFYSAFERAAPHANRDIPLWLRTSPRHPDISRTVTATKVDKKSGKHTKVQLPLNPDGVHVIQHPERGCAFFFLEMDMNTETMAEKLTKKFLAYYAYFEQATFGADIATPLARRFHLPLARPEAAPFRVLFVAPNNRRRNDLLLKSRVLPTSNLFHFAILDDVLTDPFGAIWLSKYSFRDYLETYNRRTHEDNPGLLRTWAHTVLDQLPRHGL